MATRYWFGGAGTWNSSSTAHWAAATGISFTGSRSGTTLTTVGSPALVIGMTVYTSTGTSLGTITGGSGNTWTTSLSGTVASTTMIAQTLSTAPTSSDSVIFDTNSGTGTVTVTSASATCLDFTVTASQALTFSGTLSLCTGSLSYPSGGSVSTSGLAITFTATTTGKTLTTNGKTTGAITFNGVGGAWTLSDALTSGTITLTNGTFNTGNQTISCTGLSSDNSNTRTLTLGSSSITITTGNVSLQTTTGLTLNANTSTITFTGTSGSLFSGNVTLYNVVSNTTGSFSTTGNNTFNNLTVSGPASAGIVAFFNSGNQTVNGTFTCSGSNGNQRISLAGGNVGTSATNTITAAAVSLTDVDFLNTVGAGAATWTGTRLGDGGLNSNITFATPKTVYWNLAAGGDFITSTAWATTSSGTPDTLNQPLPQDTAIFTDSGLTTSNTVTVSKARSVLPSIDFSQRTTAMNFTISSNSSVYLTHSLTLNSVVTYGNAITVLPQGTLSITSNGATVPYTLSIQVSSTLSVADNFVTTGSISFANLATGGSILFNNNNITAATFSTNSSTLPTLNFGTGKLIITGNNATVLTMLPGTLVGGIVDLTYSGATGTRTLNVTIDSSGNRLEQVNVTAGSDIIGATGGQSYGSLNFTGFSGTLTNASRTINGDLTLSSSMTLTAGTSATAFGATSGTKIITTNGKTLDFPINFTGLGGTWQLADNFTQGATRTTTITAGTLDFNGKTYTCGSSFVSSGTGTRNLTWNGGTLVCTGNFTRSGSSGFSTTVGTGVGKVSMTSASAKSFDSGTGSWNYNCTVENAGAGALSIISSSSISFYDITTTVTPATIKFQDGGFFTVSQFTLSGTAGNPVTLTNISSVSNFFLSKSSGVVSVSYCTISYSSAAGGAAWQAYTINGNSDGGNNTGWLFTEPSAGGLFFGSNF